MIFGMFFSTSFLVSIILLVFLYKVRNVPITRGLIKGTILISFWILMEALCYYIKINSMAVMFQKAKFISIILIPPIYVLTANKYAKKKEKGLIYSILIFIVPILSLLSLISNSIPYKFISDARILYQNSIPIFAFTPNIGFWIHTVYSYGNIFFVLYILMMHAIKSPRLYRRQSTFIFVGSIISFIINVMVISLEFGPTFIDTTSVCELATLVVFYWGLFRMPQSAIIPHARDLVIENIKDLVIILDSSDCIIDINPAARKFIRLYANKNKGIDIHNGMNLRGIEISKVLEIIPDLKSISDTNDDSTLAFSFEDSTFYFSIYESPIYDVDKAKIGKLIMLHHITQMQEYMNSLKVLNENLETKVIEIKKSKDDLKEVSDKLESIIESTDDLIWSVDKNYCMVSFNSALKEHLESYGKYIKTGSTINEQISGDGVELWKSFYDKAIFSGKHNFEYKTLKGEKYIEVFFNPIYNNGIVNEVAVFAKDVTERRKAEQELIRLNQELEQRVKDRTSELQNALVEMEAFTYTVSHDLKSPLRAIEGYSRIIVEDYGKTIDNEALQMTNNVIGICSEMIDLINKLLQYSTASKLSLNRECIVIKEMFVAIFNELKSTCSDRIIKLTFETEIPDVMADNILIRQVVYNILSNAVKFTKNKDIALISIGCTREYSELVFCVKDNGAGFYMEYAGKLFGMFQRLHNAEEYEGSGIGLATVHKIIEKHEGRVWIKGELDKGAEVYFTLPL
jgi:PAS domain S-box-containing protein